MGVVAMAVSSIVVPLVSLLTKNKIKAEEKEQIEEIFTCYDKK
jgi:Na+-translocating ferredoxin:NAD+ oxidoreductase RnfG subunit